MAQEARLQSRVIADMKKNGWLPIKIIRCNLSGFPDGLFLRKKKIVFIEFKAPKKKLKPLQEYVHEQLRFHEFDVYVVDTWDGYQKLSL